MPRPKTTNFFCFACGSTSQRILRNLCSKHYAKLKRYGDPMIMVNDCDSSPEEKFWSRIEKTDGCWLWTRGTNSGGYGKFTVKGRMYYAHVFSFYLANGYWPTLDVLHSCDTPRCVNPEHLREGTQKDNAYDMVSRGRASLGGATLSWAKVETIRELLAEGREVNVIAYQFGVSARTIRDIRQGRTWVQGQADSPYVKRAAESYSGRYVYAEAK
jgi:hypothetical protein